MSQLPKVSVICLCYNHAEFVIEALNSVKNQAYPNIEIIVVDDFSQDDAQTKISDWSKLNHDAKIILNQTNQGNTKAFNQGLRLATGEYVVDFATDDVMLPHCINRMVEQFEISKFQNLGVVYSNAALINRFGTVTGYFFEVDSNQKAVANQLTGHIYQTIIGSGIHICQVAMLVKKEVYDKLDGYNESLSFEDLDFWIRSSRFFCYDYVDEVLCHKRMLATSLSMQFDKIFNKQTKRLNKSTYIILKHAFYEFNTTRKDDYSLLTRIHYEMVLCFKTFHFNLLIKYILLEINLRFFTKRQNLTDESIVL